MIKMQTALLILTVFIACLYFSAKRKNDINHKLFSSMLPLETEPEEAYSHSDTNGGRNCSFSLSAFLSGQSD